jgi:hypothetical protein
MEPLPWYKSAIIRQQIVAFVLAAFGLFKFKSDLDIDATVGAILAGVAAIIPVWTILTRLFKPSPNMTVTAANKEAQLKADGKMVEPVADRTPQAQSGFARVGLLLMLGVISGGVVVVGSMTGCAVNPNKTAQTAEQQGDAVYGEVTILTEQGAAILQDASVADSLKRPIAQAIVDAKPIKDSLQDSLILYSQVKAQVAAGTNTQERLAVVDRELAGWIAQAQPLINKLAAAIAGARK